MNAYEGIPVPVLLVLVLAAFFAGAAHHTRFGRHLYAIGGNREAAFYSGIAIERHIVGVFTVMGLAVGGGRHRAHRARGIGHLGRGPDDGAGRDRGRGHRRHLAARRPGHGLGRAARGRW